MVHQPWGGSWTEEKLDCVRKYLSAYTKALKDELFSLSYIDAFAGSGIREARRSVDLPLLNLVGMDQFVRGSARIALETRPAFDRFSFIEKKRSTFIKLQNSLTADYPDMSSRMQFRNQDANTAVRDICSTTSWRKNRAVAFLDPYGMQVEWATIEAIAQTGAIDMWYLFPAGIGVGRMVPRRAEKQPEAWAKKIDVCLGGTDWRQIFYDETPTPDLFGASHSVKQRVFDIPIIEKYVRSKLEGIFPGVADNTLALSKPNGPIMYLLFFACANKRGAPIALRIANDNILGAKRGKRHRD
jgi:three-Cys-motif partner protein